jgi:iron complex outermembrane receptor protein
MDRKHPHRKPLSKAVALALQTFGLATGGALLVASAHAQTDAPPPAAPATALPEVVVTAQRREESLQDVGVAVSSLDGEALKDRGITEINQLQDVTPSLEIEPAFGSGQPQFRIRGVGFQDYTSNNTPTVGVSVDEVARPLPIMTQGQLFDLQRVEVLRGPQGTLYGRNTTAGAINFIIEKPTNTFSSGLDLNYGSNEAFNGEGFLSGPISDKLRARLSFANKSGGAWQENRDTGKDFGDKDESAVRGQLEWDATERVNLRLVLDSSYDKSDGTGLRLLNDFGSQANGIYPADRHDDKTGWGLSPAFADAIGENASSKPGRDNHGKGIALHADIDLDAVRLTSISAYNTLNRRELMDWDATTARESDEYFHSDAKVLSQELRLSSNTPGPLDWVTGVYYSKEKLDEDFYSDFQDVFGFVAKTSYKQEAESLGVFGQSGYRLTDDLRLITGLRYEGEDRELNDFLTSNSAGVGFTPEHSRSTSMHEFSGKLGLEYNLTESTLLYASISRGVKSGGFSAHNTTVLAQTEAFKPEKLLAYEVGFKSDLSDSLRLNGAVFYYDYRDQQVLGIDWDPTYGPIGTILNAPRSKLYGGELELEWAPLSGLTITQALGYKEGEYTDFDAVDLPSSQAAGGPVLKDYEGDSLNFPKLSYQGGIAYTWRVADLDLTAQADYSYRSDYNSWLGKKYDIDGYWLADARFEVSPVGSQLSYAVWGHNLFDKEYDLTRNFFVNADIAQAGEPASYGVQLKYRY